MVSIELRILQVDIFYTLACSRHVNFYSILTYICDLSVTSSSLAKAV